MQISALDYSTFVGRIGVGRINSGTLRAGADVLIMEGADGKRIWYGNQDTTYVGINWSITASCPAPEIIVRLIDYMWDPYISMQNNMGPIGTVYEKIDDPAYPDRAAALAKKTGLRLAPLAVTAGMQALPDAVPNPEPIAWLRQIAASAHVITDSFHGAAMAAILGKPLTIVRRWRDGDPGSKNSRIDQLMRQMGWTEDDACLPGADADIRLEALRMLGLSWLRAAVEESLESIRQG